MNNVLSAILKIAPSIGTVLGGPLAGSAISCIESSLGVKIDATDPTKRDTQVAAAIAGATPDQLLQLKQADLDFQAKMTELGFENSAALAKLSVEDRESARSREVSIKDQTPKILAYAYGAMFFITLLAEICMAIWCHNVDQLVMKSVDILLGVLTGMVLGTKEYYFGSSVGSDHKTEIIAASAQQQQQQQ